ncbi:class I SAM-dependent methyltransferase [Methylobacterium nodulans]|uniref:Methyltransferase type 12 n=1 Tax=Methylobacterium nodulans (strain LMG 21967 / CNCM I-2342 / ORS 2060) TaxID=460265 RepID=B8IGJ0_METNO|nr:methyltransferase domain-containing protein [Methylobacterium nodulans]ACL55890.1 conserved hypothetical protein [Methylobacterium nodulans ORS 2060]
MENVCDSGDAGFLVSFVRSRPALKQLLRRPLERVGFGTTDWVREVMYEECFAYLNRLGPQNLEVLEISAGPQWRQNFSFRSYAETQFPEFDICSQALPRTFDVIIADQVFEHLPWPYRAVKNVHAMLRPGGVFIIATPFLVRVHNVPIDCNRWTETGLSHLLQEGGFLPSNIETRSWGNRACVVGNFKRWRKRGFFGSRCNEANFPVMVWAYARRAPDDGDGRR